MRPFFLLLFYLLLVGVCSGQSDRQILRKITEHADSSSQVMTTVRYLADVYGPRMLGTPQYYESAQWAKKLLEQWGVKGVKLESFDQNYLGWTTEGFHFEMIEPSYASLRAYPLAFSQSSQGRQRGKPVLIDAFNEIYQLAGKLQGKIIFLRGYYRPVSNVERKMSNRLEENVLLRAAANPDPNDVIVGYHSRRSTVDVFGRRARIKRERTKFFKFCAEQGAIAIVEPSDFPYGILHADGNRAIPSLHEAGDIKPLPAFALSNEHFGRIVRLMDLGIIPEIDLNLKATFYENPKYNVNLIAEIPGTDPTLGEEVVIIGAHLDSWHAG
ncbi:MAG: hypothetical protein AAGA62_17140, partial [Bacteroidota bacterium]